jgi:hypothetical protein
MSTVDRAYLDGLKRELRDATDPGKRDQIQAEIRRVGSGDAPSEPSEATPADADRTDVAAKPTRPAKATASKPQP